MLAFSHAQLQAVAPGAPHGVGSITVAFTPRRASCKARDEPIMPPPATSTDDAIEGCCSTGWAQGADLLAPHLRSHRLNLLTWTCIANAALVEQSPASQTRTMDPQALMRQTSSLGKALLPAPAPIARPIVATSVSRPSRRQLLSMPLLGLAGVAMLKPVGPASAELPPTPAPAVTKNDLAKTGVLAGISAG